MTMYALYRTLCTCDAGDMQGHIVYVYIMSSILQVLRYGQSGFL